MARRMRRSSGGFGGLGGLDPMRLLQQIQQQMDAIQQEIAASRVEGSAGGGAVRVVMSGDLRVLEVHLEPDLLAEDDVEMLQDLLVSAFNQAAEAARRLSEEKMGPLKDMMGGLGLPF